MNASENMTAVAVFDDYRTAERVATELANSGIPRDSIDVRSNFMTGAAGRSGYSTDEEEGGISGFFHRLFGSHGKEEEHGHYAEAVRRGSAVVAVTAPQPELERAIDIMNAAGAVDIDTRVEQYRKTGYERYDPNAPAYSDEDVRRERERYGRDVSDRSIPVIEEELQVGKRVVRRGAVRVYSQVIEQPVEQDVTLREEHVRVERRPADRPVEPGDVERMRDQAIEMTESVEEPVVEKRARVKEEVVLGKETTERRERVRDTVRRTEVKVEQAGKDAAGYADDYSQDFRRDWEANYATSGGRYEDYQPAYEYGSRMAADPRYRGRSWSEVENDMRSDWGRQYPNSPWERFKNSVRYGWDRVTGKH